MARVDIVMPVRNGMPFVEAAIRSVMAQTERDWRLFVLDHASTDATPAMVDALAREDSRITRTPFGPELTVSEVRNRGFAMSDADYVMLHDADDLSVPTRLAQQRAWLDRLPDLALVGGGYDVIDPADKLIGARRLPSDPARISVAALFSNPIAHPTVMIRTVAFERLGARYGDSFLAAPLGLAPFLMPTLAEDYLLFGQLATLRLCGNVPAPLIRYRRHDASVGVSNFVNQMTASAEVSRHLMQILVARHGVAYCDPAPFCNHGARLYPIDDAATLPEQWRTLRAAIEQVFGTSAGVTRELAFRDTLADRRSLPMLGRFAAFLATHRADSDEVATIKTIVRARISKS